MAPSVMLALTLAHLFIAFACGQMHNISSESCPVTQTQQLTVNGCPIFVHDVTGTKDFVVEPLMCITQSLSNLFPQIDPLSQKMFVSVPVTLRNDAMLAQIKNQLQHLSPNSVKFAPISKISVSTGASSKCVQALMFLWSADEEVGYLRLGGQDSPANCRSFFVSLKDSIFDAINGVTATAEIQMGSALTELKYKLMLQNQILFHPEFYGSKFEYESNCDNLQFIQSVIVDKCIARVYQRQGVNGRFYIEPLLCPSNSVTSESITYDYSRDMYYLKLDVVLQDNIALNAVQSKLAHLSPANVSFLQLWRVDIGVSSFLSSRFDVGPLMVSGDWRSGQVRVYCKTEDDCKILRSNMTANPLSFWGHVNLEVISHIPSQCTVRSGRHIYNLRLTEISGIGLLNSHQDIVAKLRLSTKYQTKTVDGRQYAIIQQRKSNSVSFARTWNEYEVGFGDATNFWIGLSTIHLLSINGTTIRMETTLMNGSEYYREYADFKVRDASTNYTVTIGEFIASRSNDNDSTNHWRGYMNGMQFSTMDRDNDKNSRSCSIYGDEGGNGGWWFNHCAYDNPNHGIFRHHWMVGISNGRGVGNIASEVRLMLQI